MKILFIGGDSDGQRIEVTIPPPLQIMRQVRQTSPPTYNTIDGISSCGCVVVQSYRREELRDANGESHLIYIAGGDVNAPIARLIAGYGRMKP